MHAAETEAFNLEHLQLETNAFFYVVSFIAWGDREYQGGADPDSDPDSDPDADPHLGPYCNA